MGLIALRNVPAYAEDSAVEYEHSQLSRRLMEFERLTGATIVFDQDQLPPGRYHDVLKPLARESRSKAVEICIEEASLYPPRYFREVGLKSIGVFAACASKQTTDRSRTYDAQLGGYRYFGVYNGRDAIAASFYTDGQLALTFHHEIFHHIDSTVGGVTERWQLSSDDAFYQAALSGLRPMRPPSIPESDLELLKRQCRGMTLKDAVSDYAAKNSREDQAETARHLMSMLPNSLVQAIEQPNLRGSQRILHILNEIAQSVPDGPSFDWFVDVALQRADRRMPISDIEQLTIELQTAAISPRRRDKYPSQDARFAIRSLVRLPPGQTESKRLAELVDLTCRVTHRLLMERLLPDKQFKSFAIHGFENSEGVNHTLRHDLQVLARDADRLADIADQLGIANDVKFHSTIDSALATNLRWIARYFLFIQSSWAVTDGTLNAFESTRDSFINAMTDEAAGECRGGSFAELAR